MQQLLKKNHMLDIDRTDRNEQQMRVPHPDEFVSD